VRRPQCIETVPIKDIKARMHDLNNDGWRVVAITIDREGEQFWLVIEK
jgi:hypothetical protein